MNPARTPAPSPRRNRMQRLMVSLVLAASAAAAVLGCGGSVTKAASQPSGKVAFVGTDGLYVAPADGAAPRRIWTTPAGARQPRDPRWSPDGSHIAFVGPDANIWTVNADGSGARAVTAQAVQPSGCGEDTCTDPGASADSPRWSPDGATISYRLVQALAKGSIWSMPASGGAPTLVAQSQDLCIFNEGFTPAGVPLFSRCAASLGPSNATFAGGNAQRPLFAGSQVAFSADGKQVAFSSQAMDSQSVVVKLYVAAADGSGTRAAADDGQNPAWSKSGLLAYQVAGTNGWTVHVLDLASSTDTVVAHGQIGGWTADGGSLYYTTTDDSGSWIWTVRADGSGAHRLAEGDSPDWTR